MDIEMQIKGLCKVGVSEKDAIDALHNCKADKDQSLDLLFCDNLVKQDLDTLEYVDFKLSDFVVSSPLDEKTALNLAKYYVRSCFSPNLTPCQKWYYIMTTPHYLKNSEWVKKLLEYTKVLLQQQKLNKNVVNELGRYLSIILFLSPVDYFRSLFSDLLSLQYGLSKQSQYTFANAILDNTIHWLALKTRLKELVECVNACSPIANLQSWFKSTVLKEIVDTNDRLLQKTYDVDVLFQTLYKCVE